MRLFIALPTPLPVRSAMAELVRTLGESRAEVKWDTQDKFHCTLKFLGATKDTLTAGIIDRLARITAETPPLDVAYRTLGCFPTPRDPRVIWVGVEERSGLLIRLQEEIENAMADLGFAREDRKFHPHVTLGRVKGRAGIRNLITRLESVTFESTAATIAQIELISSDLRPGGSVYTTQKTFLLSGPHP
jgi:2'-5' RNA ligase